MTDQEREGSLFKKMKEKKDAREPFRALSNIHWAFQCTLHFNEKKTHMLLVNMLRFVTVSKEFSCAAR